VEVYTTSGNQLYSRSSYPDYFDLRDSGVFASLAAFTEVPITMDANGGPEPLAGQLVSGNYFDVLGIRIPLGRGLTPQDDRIESRVRAAVISYALWQRVFNADASVIGRTMRLNSNNYARLSIHPDEGGFDAGVHASGGINQSAGLRYGELSGTGFIIAIRRIYGLHDVVHKRERLASRPELRHVEWHGRERAHLHEQQMAGRNVSGIDSALDDFTNFLRVAQINHDSAAGPIGINDRSEQH